MHQDYEAGSEFPAYFVDRYDLKKCQGLDHICVTYGVHVFKIHLFTKVVFFFFFFHGN